MAPSKSIIGGNFQDALGNLITGNLLLVLPTDAQIPGIGPIAPVHIRIPISGGSVASTPIWFNDQLSPSNTAYIATAYDSTGNKVYGPELWAITGASPFNLSSIVPLLISPDPLFSNPVLQNPASPQTITGQSLTLTSSAPLIVQGTLSTPAIGPVPSQQHTLPAVASDVVALLAAAQTFTNKTLSGGTLSGTIAGTPTLSGNIAFSGNPTVVGSGTLGFTGSGSLVFSAMLMSATAPIISSGFGTSPSIVTSNGTASFTVNVGTGGTASSGVIGLPASTNGWNCFCEDINTFSTTVFRTRQTVSAQSSCTIGNFNTSAAAAAWASGDTLVCIALAR